ncbi:YveK family protein [Paenibacillus hexagrammi]|uniref:Wzz/FepE/Etk N-terminal domain-containing protein n=1 Tax=Paenibacillus hexagrammi TaxID=2908839 RepID=A0ABY3SFL4_9BACL|nr:Wzz/FepE/Etk N-terminal domain-containing protein [Paenibacillus sp. YPD9-1]UJF32782.1 Wzz/FepE/Etk N-terminal domain-containing protein [Paenibacillus sp. YPD9-1]
MNFQEFLRLLRTRWWIIVCITVTTTTITYIQNSYFVKPEYANSATLLINDRHSNEKYSLTFDDVLLYEKLIGTYRDIILSNKVLNIVSHEMQTEYHTTLSASEIRRIITVSTSNNSQVITITAQYTDYILATNLVNLVAKAFSENLKAIMNVDNVSIVDEAVVNSPVPPLALQPN